MGEKGDWDEQRREEGSREDFNCLLAYSQIAALFDRQEEKEEEGLGAYVSYIGLLKFLIIVLKIKKKEEEEGPVDNVGKSASPYER